MKTRSPLHGKIRNSNRGLETETGQGVVLRVPRSCFDVTPLLPLPAQTTKKPRAFKRAPVGVSESHWAASFSLKNFRRPTKATMAYRPYVTHFQYNTILFAIRESRI